MLASISLRRIVHYHSTLRAEGAVAGGRGVLLFIDPRLNDDEKAKAMTALVLDLGAARLSQRITPKPSPPPCQRRQPPPPITFLGMPQSGREP